MLPTPHGPTDAPLPVGAVDATVGTGRTPDEGALLRVVEHLADVPDGEVDDEPPGTADAHEPAADDGPATPNDEPGDGPGDDEPADHQAGDDEASDDEGSDGEVDGPGDEPGDEPRDEPDDEPGDDDESSADAADAHEAVEDRPEDAADDGTEDAADEPAGVGSTADAARRDEPVAETGADDDEPAAPPAAPPSTVPHHEVGPVAAALSDTRHRIDELNATERLFLGQQRSLVAELCTDPSDVAVVGALFDRVHEQWRQSQDRPDLQPLADAFGVALGDLVCAEAPDLGWATCSDRFGTEIVLAREDPEVLVYPIAAVAQSWELAGPGWFVRHLTTVLQGVAPGPRTAGS